MMDGPNGIKAQVCRADFYNKMADALDQCGGINTPTAIDRYQNMPLFEVVNILAQNGIRMVYLPDCHIDKVNI